MPGRATRLGEREAGGSQPAVPEAWHIVGSQSTSGTMFRIGAEEVSLGRQHCWGGGRKQWAPLVWLLPVGGQPPRIGIPLSLSGPHPAPLLAGPGHCLKALYF